ncbi:MAG: DUF2199 domain-containing protein [Pseudomonadota bacterium]
MRLTLIHPQTMVFTCKRVMEDPAAMCFVAHDEDGDWSFLCDGYHSGDEADPEDTIDTLFAADLTSRFPQLDSLEHLERDQEADQDPEGTWHVVLEREVPPGAALEGWSYTCACCGEEKVGVPELSCLGPDLWASRNRVEGVREVEKDSDFCVLEVDGARHFYIRVLLPIPLPFAGRADDHWCFGVWTTLSEKNFDAYRAGFQTGEAAPGPMTGWLANNLPTYPAEQIGLITVPQRGNRRPYAFLNKVHAEHPIFVEQRDGWSEEQLAEKLSSIMPCGDGN